MKITFKAFLMISFILGGEFYGVAQTQEQRNEIIRNYDLGKLKDLEIQLLNKSTKEKQEALELAEANGWPLFITERNGTYKELKKVIDGKPIYFQTYNSGSAITSGVNKINTGGSAGLNLNGQNMIIGIWDGGGVRITHQDITASRATQKDNAFFTPTEISEGEDHATHVAGTMMGSGVWNSTAKGMAYQAYLWANDWNNDTSEMVNQASQGLLISNHSYGLDAQALPLYFFGAYVAESKIWDQITFNAPYYQPVVAAGNDREEAGQLTNKGGKDLLFEQATAKNTIVVAAVNGVLSYTNASSVVMSSFSNWGPTDDFRVKPDISDKGVGVLSTVAASNSSYGSKQGTSMAAPGVAGALLLLQQHYNNLNNGFMRSATLRGVMAHTAKEAGAHLGPDHKFGWGLINAEGGAAVISGDGTSSFISEETLTQAQTYTKTVISDGVNPLKVTISWTDPAGNVSMGTVDATTPALINDLDLRVTKGAEVLLPYKLNPNFLDGAPSKADNAVDNIEKIEQVNAVGTYVITVNHKGNLQGGAQDFSIVVSGINETLDVNDYNFSSKIKMWPNPAKDVLNISLEDVSDSLDLIVIYDVQGREIIRKNNISNNSNNSIDISGISSGVYMVEFISGNNRISKKLIKS